MVYAVQHGASAMDGKHVLPEEGGTKCPINKQLIQSASTRFPIKQYQNGYGCSWPFLRTDYLRFICFDAVNEKVIEKNGAN